MPDNLSNFNSDSTNRQWLELELRRIRSEASAARLEARAAALELLIHRLESAPVVQVPIEAAQSASVLLSAGQPSTITVSTLQSKTSFFESWDHIHAIQNRLAQVPVQGEDTLAKERGATEVPQQLIRIDAPSRPRPRMLHNNDTRLVQEDSDTLDLPIPDERDSVTLAALADVETSESGGLQKTRKRSLAFIVSTSIHVAVLILLAAWTLSDQRPKDQFAITASASSATEVLMESLEVETSEPLVEQTEATPQESAYEVSPIGELSAAEITPPIQSSLQPNAVPEMFQAASASAGPLSKIDMKSDSRMTTQFCGVEGGGNHFVYLVDSSGSMGLGFDSARAELLKSIDELKPNQRFYVIFFDAEPDFMRLSSSNVDEPQSVSATTENKQALRRWAMRIHQDRGKAPYDVLRFALQLRADVIFLLSDGEFPQGIEDLLKEHNKVTNLFGDSKNVSIVHTIAYFSEEGESRMRRIAQQNGGQYRYVPRP